MGKRKANYGPLFAYFYPAEERPSFRPGLDCPRKGWCLATMNKSGSIMCAVTRDGTGLFNSKVEVERILGSLKDQGVTAGDHLVGLNKDKFKKMIYRDLFW